MPPTWFPSYSDFLLQDHDHLQWTARDGDLECDAARLFQALKHPKVQRLFKFITGRDGEAVVVAEPAHFSRAHSVLHKSSHLVDLCIQTFGGIGLWSLPNLAVSKSDLVISLSKAFETHHLWISELFSRDERLDLTSSDECMVLAQEIFKYFANPKRNPFPSEGRVAKTPTWLAKLQRKTIQLQLFKRIAAEDVAHSDYYAARIEYGEDIRAVEQAAEIEHRRTKADTLSEYAWSLFFHELSLKSPENDSDAARERLKAAYMGRGQRATYQALLPEIRNSRRYIENLTKLRGPEQEIYSDFDEE